MSPYLLLFCVQLLYSVPLKFTINSNYEH